MSKVKLKMKIDPNITKNDYVTISGELLWIDHKRHDDYSSEVNCKILIDSNGKVWGYSDDGRLLNRDFGHGILK